LFRRSSNNLSCLTQSVGGLPGLSHHPNTAVVAASVSAFDERIIKTKPKYFLNLTYELGYGPLVEQVGRRVLRRTSFEET